MISSLPTTGTTRVATIIVAALSSLLVLAWPQASESTTSHAGKVDTAGSHTGLFEANRGQFADGIDYLARAPGMNVALSASPIIELYRIESRQVAVSPDQSDATSLERKLVDRQHLQLHFHNAGKPIARTALEPARARINYLSGNDRANWKRDVPTYGRIRYSGLYPDTDIDYYMNEGRLEFAVRLAPGADPERVVFDYSGVDNIELDDSGRIIVRTGGRALHLKSPKAWQVIDGQRETVRVAYEKREDGIGFELGQHDPQAELVIDPVLDYSSYYGGSGNEDIRAVDTDANGNIYLIGETASTGLATSPAFRETNVPGRNERTRSLFCPSCTDAVMDIAMRTRIDHLENSLFVSKFTPDGDTLLWTTYINAAGNAHSSLELGVNSIAVNGVGSTAFALNASPDMPDNLPLVNEVQGHDSSKLHTYVAKLDTDGENLVFGTYLQLADENTGTALQRGLDIDATGQVALTGGVGPGNNLPEVNALSGQSCTLDSSINEFIDGFVTLLDTNGGVAMSTCLGGDMHPSGATTYEFARGVAIGTNGHVYALGYTSATDFPVVNAIQSSPGYSGSRDMYITEINPDDGTGSSAIEFSTYFGPPAAGSVASDLGATYQGYFPIDILVNDLGTITVTGVTNELHYPVAAAHQPNLAHPRSSYGYEFQPGDQDMFVTRMIPGTGTVVYSTYLGGSGSEDGLHSMTADPYGNVYIVTVTESPDYPLLAEIDGTLDGETDLGISKITPEGRLAFSTYLGGTDDAMIQVPGGIAAPDNDTLVVAGNTEADDFPVLGALQPTRAGGTDGTLTIIDFSGDTDIDQDGVIDSADPFPNDPDEWRDTDGDGTGNNTDSDDDGDGENDSFDTFPLDATEQVDTDGDGAGDNLDEFDGDNTGAFDLDGDGTHDFADTDADNDGTDNGNEDSEFVLDPNETQDYDFDGIGDNADTDADGDGIPDTDDPAPLNESDPIITFNQFFPYETGLFPSPLPADFSTPSGADTAWTAALDRTWQGERSLGSLDPGNSGESIVEYARNTGNGQLQFRFRVDSEVAVDQLLFELDGHTMLAESGDSGWRLFTTPVTAGMHTLRWTYAKNASGEAGDDAAWIDHIRVRTDIGDLAIDVDNSLLVVPGGDPVTYTITVTNHGPSDVAGAGVNAMIPPELMNATWTCSGTAGAACGSTSGSGALDTGGDTLPVGGSVAYMVTADAQSSPEEPVIFFAEINIPPDFEDTLTSNDSDVDEDDIGVFGDGFE